MKLFSFTVLLSLASLTALAGVPSVDCAKEAYDWIGDARLATRLCWGATSNAPVHCARAAYDIIGDANLATALCAGATSDEPVACLKQAYEADGGDYAQAVLLCLGAR